MEDKGAGAVNRYALDQLPAEVERIAVWVRSMADAQTSELSDWSDDERERFRPGCELLVELVDGELEDARGDFRAVQEAVGTDAQVLLAQKPTRYRHILQVESDQAHWREQIRAVLRGYLREVVDIGRALGVADEDLPALLEQAAADPEPPPDAQVIPMATARTKRDRRSDQ
jgi:hypothetical protein